MRLIGFAITIYSLDDNMKLESIIERMNGGTV